MSETTINQARERRPPVVVVLGHVDHGKCVHPDTRIPLADGSIQVAKELWEQFTPRGIKVTSRQDEEVFEVKNGPEVIAWNGEQFQSARVSHLWKIKNHSKLLEFTMRSGDHITTTPGHPFLTLTSEGKFVFKKAANVNEEDFIAVPQTIPLADAPLRALKEMILIRLAQAGEFVALLDRGRGRHLAALLHKANKMQLFRNGVFTTQPVGILKSLRFRIDDLVRLARHFNIPLSEIYGYIDRIKNANRKWRVGHSSSYIRLPQKKRDFEGLGYLIGLIIGDGHLDEHELTLHNNDTEIQTAFIKITNDIFGVSPQLVRGHTAWMIRSGGYKTLVRFLHHVFDIPRGNKSALVRIPDIVKISACMRREAIAGVFDTDGYVSKNNHSAELTSKSELLIKDISTLFLEHGVHSRIFKKNGYWYLCISNHPYLQRFYSRYPLRHKTKSSRIRDALPKTSTSRIFDLTPLAGSIIRQERIPEAILPYFNKYKAQSELSRPFLTRLFKHHGTIFSRCFEKTQLKPLLNPGEISVVKVAKKKTVRGIPYVYDFTVPTFKNFIAERVIVHNTTLLDYIRKTNIAEKEAGSITQHIGAYQIEVPQEPKSSKITFLDTPGHEAFSAIRSRGAKVADIAVLVIAAEEGLKPQTKEAIKHIKEAGIPFIAALNKIDKPEAKPAMVKQQLAEAEVFVEGLGGQVPVVEISAKTGKGVDELLELVLLTAELEDLKTDAGQKAGGVVIESHLDPKRGYVATLLVQKGTLKTGDFAVSGGTFAKIKMLEDFAGKIIHEASPSQPVLTLGWSQAPDVGQKFEAAETKDEAERSASQWVSAEPALFIKESGPKKENKKTLNLVFKADVQSSLEAVNEAIKGIGNEEAGYNVVDYGIGNIKDNDIRTAATGFGTIYGFYVDAENSSKRLAEKEKVKIKIFRIIYELVEELRKDISDLLEPEIRILPLGRLKVLKTFKTGSNYQVIGGKVVSGYAERGAMIDVSRNDAKVVSGRLAELQHNKVNVQEVKEGLEAGIRFEGPAEIKEGDLLEIYKKEIIKRSI